MDIVNEMIAIALATADAVGAKHGDGREGGYFCASLPATIGRTRIPRRVGHPEKEKLSKYRRLAQEKADRLLEHPEHLLSWQSRNPDEGRWGGAVLLKGGLIISFSGFPEMVDEAFCLAIASQSGHLDDQHVQERLNLSGNQKVYQEVSCTVRQALE